MLQVDWKSRTPIYDQIVAGVARLRRLGALQPGDQLPSVRSLAVTLGVNPNTVQKAYAILESNGVIYSAPGRGSFLSDGAAAEKLLEDLGEDEFREAVRRALQAGMGAARLKAIVDQMQEEAQRHD